MSKNREKNKTGQKYGLDLAKEFDFTAQVVEEKEIRPKTSGQRKTVASDEDLFRRNNVVTNNNVAYEGANRLRNKENNPAPQQSANSVQENIVQREKTNYKKTKEIKTKLGVNEMAFGRDDLRDTNRTYDSSERGDKLVGVETERRLTVGSGITLKGEISDCDKLVIFGDVDAVLNNVTSVHITESGLFHGSAEVETCEVSGLFEGELKVRGHITINSTGKINGKITYGSIEIRPGGKFTGEIVEEEYKLGGKSGKLSRPVSETTKTTTNSRPTTEEGTTEDSPSFESVEI